MAVNHVNLSNGEELIDLRHDTVTKDVLFKGYTAHGADGEPIVGEYEAESDVIASGSCGENAIWTFYNDGRFVVSGSGKAVATDEYSSIKNDIMTVIFEDGITEIGNGFGDNFENVVNILIADSVDVIGGSFKKCYSLENIIFPNNMTSIMSYAFWMCTNLRSVMIPNGITKVEDSAFSNCSSLKSVIFPESLKSIEEAFGLCTSLESVVIPEGLTELGVYAFESCSSLKSVTIPKSLSFISAGVFMNCPALETIYYAGTKEEWDSITIEPPDEYANNDWLNQVTLCCEYDPNADTVDGWNVNVITDDSDVGNITEPTITFMYTVGG